VSRISPDLRVRAIALLLVPGFVGHFIQLAGEDSPWTDWAALRYWHTPGWHLELHPSVPIAIAAALVLAVIGLVVRRTRRWMVAIAILYAAHYLTYPYRIRNHMTHMLAELTIFGGISAIVWLSGKKPSHSTERAAMNGMAAVLCVTYVSAALHKVNANFLAFDAARSSAVDGLTTFWIYGDLGSAPPLWAMAIAIYGTIAIEALAPIVAWRVHALRVPAVLVLFAFHMPHVAVMNVADYPMIASAFYPAFFSHAHFRIFMRHARRPNAYTVGGAILGAALQLWFMPYFGALMALGIFVLALWGWAAGAMIRMLVHARRKPSPSRQRFSRAVDGVATRKKEPT
jgi:hypothetical protein